MCVCPYYIVVGLRANDSAMTTTYYSTVFALTLAMAGLNALAAEAVLIAAAAVMLLLHIDASTMVVGLDWGNPFHCIPSRTLGETACFDIYSYVKKPRVDIVPGVIAGN